MNGEVLNWLGDPQHQVDPQAHIKVVQYFEQLKASPDGWKLCAETVTSQPDLSQQVKFFGYQVIEHYIHGRYFENTTTMEELAEMKQFIMAMVQQLSGASKAGDPTFLRRKAAQLVALVCYADYPHRWPSLMLEILLCARLGHDGAQLVLLILEAIDTDVLDREVCKNLQDLERSTVIKDSMRDQCIERIVDTLYDILVAYETSEPSTACLCMEVIGRYISWIDIGLIANDKFIPKLVTYCASWSLLRESAFDCLAQVVRKGMEPAAKTQLVESLWAVLDQAGIWRAIGNEEDTDYLVRLAKFVNTVGMALLAAIEKQRKSDDAPGLALTTASLEAKIPTLLALLKHGDDDVSSSVVASAHDYIGHLKASAPLSPQQTENFRSLLLTVCHKMKYDESYNFDKQGEEEAMFEDYRGQLRTILSNLAALNPVAVMADIKDVVSETLSRWHQLPVQDTELALQLLFLLGEALPANTQPWFVAQADKASPIQLMLRQVMESGVSHCPHWPVVLQYVETITRYDKFFAVETQYFQDALASYVDKRGLRHPQAAVRSRTAYLFSRFIRDIKSLVSEYVDEVLTHLEPLLSLVTPDNGYCHLLSSDDQMFIYDSVGVLVVASQGSAEHKRELMRRLLAPVVTRFEDVMSKMVSEQDPEKQLAYAQSLHDAVGFAGRASKGFSSQATIRQCGCVEAFTESMRIFMKALDVPVHRQLLHMAVRQFLHRMVVCLEAEVLPFIPAAVEQLLKHAQAREIYDFLPLLNQVVMKFKKAIVPYLREVFVPVVRVILTVLGSAHEEGDTQAALDNALLQRGYFQFLLGLASNGVTEVLSSQESEHLEQVLQTVVEGAVHVPDPQSKKVCFALLRRLVEEWGGENGLPGFSDFILKSVIPACFLAPLEPSFDLQDAQTVLALAECSQCLKTIFDTQGAKCLNFLQNEYLPSLTSDPTVIQNYCQALQGDAKQFKSFNKRFFTEARRS